MKESSQEPLYHNFSFFIIQTNAVWSRSRKNCYQLLKTFFHRPEENKILINCSLIILSAIFFYSRHLKFNNLEFYDRSKLPRKISIFRLQTFLIIELNQHQRKFKSDLS